MERCEKWLGWVAMLVLAFTLGWLASGGGVVAAQSRAAEVELRDGNLYVYYPDLGTMYIYSGPMVGTPEKSCAYKLMLGEPGGKIKREQCPYNP